MGECENCGHSVETGESVNRLQTFCSTYCEQAWWSRPANAAFFQEEDSTLATPETNEDFEEIWAMEMLVRGERASMAFACAGQPLFVRERNARNAKKAQEKLYAMIDELVPANQTAYGAYRRAILKEIESGC